MGYTESKNKTILHLQHEVNVATKEQSKAETDATAKAATLSARTAIHAQDEQDTTTAKANVKLVEKVSSSASSSETVIGMASETTEHLHSSATEMVKVAYETALKTVHAATTLAGLSNHIEKTKTKNKLISDLLVADAKKAAADATKAVADAITALNDSIVAATSVVHLVKSLAVTKEQIETIQSIIQEKKDGLKAMLDDLYAKTHKKTEQAHEEKSKAEEASSEANKKLARESARHASLTAALAAANAAVSQ
jgi:hypothetical protein